MLNLNEPEDVELFVKKKCSLFPDIQKSIVKPDPVRFSAFGFLPYRLPPPVNKLLYCHSQTSGFHILSCLYNRRLLQAGSMKLPAAETAGYHQVKIII